MTRTKHLNAIRLNGNPIIHAGLSDTIGNNINGPSLIKAPEWLDNRLGTYYLYFAHHSGTFIRLAYSDQLEGPWTVYEPGVLPLSESGFSRHIASPDVRVDEENKQIIMYYHGGVNPEDVPEKGEMDDTIFLRQRTKVAVSEDGLHFKAYPKTIAGPYLRVFRWKDAFYGLSMPGILYRSENGINNFEAGPIVINPELYVKSKTFNEENSVRHMAVHIKHNVLRIFYSSMGDCPEHIKMSTVQLTEQWKEWKATEPVSILKPELIWEGGEMPNQPSKRGGAKGAVKQLRDPAIFEENNRLYLLYSVAGEQGIAIAELVEQ